MAKIRHIQSQISIYMNFIKQKSQKIHKTGQTHNIIKYKKGEVKWGRKQFHKKLYLKENYIQVIQPISLRLAQWFVHFEIFLNSEKMVSCNLECYLPIEIFEASYLLFRKFPKLPGNKKLKCQLLKTCLSHSIKIYLSKMAYLRKSSFIYFRKFSKLT